MIQTRLKFLTGVLASSLVTTTALTADWHSAGADLNNSRYQAKETKINASTVAR